MYNYIWVRRPDTDAWERVHNFGVDVRAYRSDGGQLINCIGMNLPTQREGNSLRVTYPNPLIQYRQFDDKIGSPETVSRYPDFTKEEMRRLVHADASLEFTYTLDPDRPSFVTTGRVTSGRVRDIVHIISALWTDNRALPTHGFYEGFDELEYDIADPAAYLHRDVEVENVAYAVSYRRDGNGLPFALLPLQPVAAGVNNYFDNWRCLRDFRAASINQQYVPDDPVVKGSNDSGYTTAPGKDGVFPGVRVVFFPHLGWHKGGLGPALRKRIERDLIDNYMGGNAADYWGRKKANRSGKLTLRSAPWE